MPSLQSTANAHEAEAECRLVVIAVVVAMALPEVLVMVQEADTAHQVVEDMDHLQLAGDTGHLLGATVAP
ncbi:hypothetical protein SLS53_003838 [Cytospora paraplurivora]|uniref:Uncharacterized protein n=1 Tax=Cytospora paraplurivora TaxID=2898453 RepID=A0AAN9UGN4_9PEZI